MENNIESFHFEIYTRNEVTLERGWDIKFVVAFGQTKKDAIEVLKNEVPFFDEIITSTAHWNGSTLNENEVKHYAEGKNWYYTDENLVN